MRLWPPGRARVLHVAPRLLLGLIAVGIVTLTLLRPELRQPDGYLKPVVVPLFIAALSLLLVGLAYGTRWLRPAKLLVLALLGQAWALQLLDVGPAIRIQHYYPWSELWLGPRLLFFLILSGQTLIVLWGSRHHWRVVWGGITRILSGWGLLVFVGVVAFASTAFSRSPTRYLLELLLAGWVIAANGLTWLLLARALPEDGLEKLTRWWRRTFLGGTAGGESQGEQLLPWAAAIWAVVVSSILAWFALDAIPHVPDEIAYLFQAKYFSHGLLYLPLPPDVESFPIPFVLAHGDQWYAATPPGWPAVLAVGVWVGLPWLVNPLLGGLAILLTHALLRRLYERQLAHAAVLLLAVSPWFLYMSASLLNHQLALVCALLGFLGVERSRASGRLGWAVLAGAALGTLTLNRPFEGFLVGSVAGLWAVGLGGRRLRVPALAGFVLAGLAVASLNLPYNQLLTGRPNYFPIMKFTDETYYPGANRLGFGPDVGNFGWTGLDPFPGHGARDVLVNTNQNAYMLNFELFGWTFGSIVFALLLLLWVRCRGPDWLFLGLLVAIVGGHSLYWFSGGPDFGARYWYQVILPVVVLTVRGVQEFGRRLEENGQARATQKLWAVVVAASLVAFVNVVPWRALDKYHHYRGIRPDIRSLSQEYAFGKSLVLIRGEVFPDYCSATIFNPATLDSADTIYAWEAGLVHRVRVREYYADRPLWIVAGPSVTGSGMRVEAGPLPASLGVASEQK